MPAWEILGVKRIMRIYQELQDIRQLPQKYRWVTRIPAVFALDEEIMARYTGRVLAADLIADDQQAVIRSANPVRLTQTKIPNLKHGELITQSMLSLLQRIEAGNASRRENGIFEDYIVNRTMELRDGVYARMEALLCAMLMDSFSYDRLGIKISGGTWAMPSDLKATSSPAWSNTSATPVTDILTLRRIASQKYGINLNRVTMGTQALLYMVATTEFKNLAALMHFGQAVPATGLPVQNVEMMTTLAGNILGMTVEIDDRQTWTENNYGTQVAAAYQTATQVILTPTEADGNGSYWDWANGTIYETMPGMVPSLIGSFEGEQQGMEGPVGYVTAADPQGNPPGMVMWGVGRGFPRKHKEAASAVITAY